MEAKEIETLVGELETNVDRLRGLYEQYFMGIERIAPAVPQKDVERRIYALRKEQIRNTAVRFRFQMIIQRYNTYQTHWMRICRQIEEGTYKRDVMRAQRRLGAPTPEAPKPAPPPDDLVPPSSQVKPLSQPPPLAFQKLELDDLDAFANLDLSAAVDPLPKSALGKAPPVPPRPVAKAQPPPAAPKKEPGKPPPLPPRPAAPAPAASISDDRLKQIYAQYVETRRSAKDASAALSYEAMAKSLRESSARLRDKHGPVDFEVAVKDGKTVLRAVVKKKA